MAPITGCLKNEEFQWSNVASKTFREFKVKMTKAPVLRYPDFTKVFEVACDASSVGIGGVLSQEGHLIASFFLVKNSMMLKEDILHMIKSFIL